MISVIIPTYNRAQTIERSIKSVLNQTYRDIELIIVDDGSTDNTYDVLKSINDERMRYIYQENHGACVARNNGINHAKGEYIAFQDSDDIWHKEKLERQVFAIENNKDVDIVCCRTRCKQLDGKEFISLERRKGGIISIKDGPYGISTQTLLMKKSVASQIQFDENVTRYQDLDFLLTAIQSFNIYLVPEILVDRYIENDSISSHPERILDMTVYFQKKHSEIMNDSKQYLSHFLASVLLETGYQLPKNERTKYYCKALEIDKSLKCTVKYLVMKMKLFSIIKRIR